MFNPELGINKFKKERPNSLRRLLLGGALMVAGTTAAGCGGSEQAASKQSTTSTEQTTTTTEFTTTTTEPTVASDPHQVYANINDAIISAGDGNLRDGNDSEEFAIKVSTSPNQDVDLGIACNGAPEVNFYIVISGQNFLTNGNCDGNINSTQIYLSTGTYKVHVEDSQRGNWAFGYSIVNT